MRRYWNWEPTGLGPYETVRARLMSRMVLVLVGAAVPSIFIQAALPGPRWAAIVPALVVALYLASLRELWRGHQQRAAGLLVGSMLVVLGMVMLPFGGISGTVPIFLVALAAVAVLLLDPGPSAVAVLAMTGLLVAAPLAAHVLGDVSLLHGERLLIGQLVCDFMAIAEVGLLGGLTVDALQATSDEARLRTEQSIRAAEQARAATEGKARFLAMMSHELRTPLNAILGYAGLLREESGPSDADLDRIETAGNRLLALVEDVLEMARAETTAHPLRLEAVDLGALAREQIVALDVVAALQAPPDPVVVRTDRGHLRKIVSTLLTQAARDRAVERLDVQIAELDGVVRLVVRDADRTIPAAMLSRAFEPFAGLDRETGTGLGLALAQRLAQQLGGGIDVDTSADHGSAFTLRLPAGAS